MLRTRCVDAYLFWCCTTLLYVVLNKKNSGEVADRLIKLPGAILNICVFQQMARRTKYTPIWT